MRYNSATHSWCHQRQLSFTTRMQPTQAIHPCRHISHGGIHDGTGLDRGNSCCLSSYRKQRCVSSSPPGLRLCLGLRPQCFTPTAAGRHPHYALRVVSKAAASTSRFLVQYIHSNRQRLWILLRVHVAAGARYSAHFENDAVPGALHYYFHSPFGDNNYNLFVCQRRYPRSI